MTELITAEEFEKRLIALCTAGGEGMPRKRRDLNILLGSATLWMEPASVYSRSDVNLALEQWLDNVCDRSRIDPVTLRRELVDASYMLRDDSGSQYTIGPGPADFRFDQDVGNVDPAAVIAKARSERHSRKSAHLDGQA